MLFFGFSHDSTRLNLKIINLLSKFDNILNDICILSNQMVKKFWDNKTEEKGKNLEVKHFSLDDLKASKK